ncbi:MAG: polysaccharide deacetylase family protein [Bacteroidota bacterium]
MKNINSRISNKLNRTITDIVFKTNLEKLVFSKKKGAVILCYHGVDLYEDKRFNMRFFSNKTLEKHFYYLKKYTNVISIQDYFEQKWDKNKLNVALTFDDGYRNNYLYLKPLVEKYQLPVSIYITGLNNTPYKFLWADFADLVLHFTKRKSFVLGNQEFRKDSNGNFLNEEGLTLKLKIKEVGNWQYKEEFFKLFESEFQEIQKKTDLSDYWQIMSDEEIQSCSKSSFISIGSHSFYHNNLDNISHSDAKKELIDSKNYLENLTQQSITELAYPDGAYSDELTHWANNELGFDKQLALSFRFDDDKNKSFMRSRTGLYPVDTIPNQLRNIQPFLTF